MLDAIVVTLRMVQILCWCILILPTVGTSLKSLVPLWWLREECPSEKQLKMDQLAVAVNWNVESRSLMYSGRKLTELWMCHHNDDNVKVASEDWHIEFQVSVSKTSCFLFIAEKGRRKKERKKMLYFSWKVKSLRSLLWIYKILSLTTLPCIVFTTSFGGILACKQMLWILTAMKKQNESV